MNACARLARSAFCLLWLAPGAGAADYRATPDNYREYLSRLEPGDRLRLEAGDYLRGLPLHDLAGRAGQPIVIEGSGHTRLIARQGANTVSLVDVRYLHIRNLELDGRNLPVDAVKAEGHSRYADFVTLENLSIHDHAASQQNVGISTKCPAFGWVIRDNRIERVGTGMYFGDADGSDPFVAGLIEGNRIAGTLGYNLQIKHQKSRPDDATERAVDTLIRYNVFSKQGAASGAQARPNVLLGHFPLSGSGSRDRYLVYGNLFLHNPSEALLQAEGRVAIYDNAFINRSGDAIHIQPHNDVPRDIVIFSNTVLASGTGIQVRRTEGTPYHQRVIANVVAAGTPLQGGETAHNLALDYRPELLDIAVPELAGRLLHSQPPRRLPDTLLRELATYPDWHWPARPGASIAPALMRMLERPPQ